MSGFAYPLTGLVSIATLIVYILQGIAVGKARASFGVHAPATTGPDAFMRVLRVHANTLEQLPFFFVSLWLFAISYSDFPAALVGVVFPLGRVIYARGYYADAAKRGTGFMIGFLSCAVLAAGAAVAFLRSLLGF